MIAEQRLIKIHEWVQNEGVVTFKELKQRLNVSKMTILRDIKKLQQKGILERKWGGAVYTPPQFQIEDAFKAKKDTRSFIKDRIARYGVQNFVKENDIVCLEGGTTVFHMMKYLDMKHVHIITNGLFQLHEAIRFKNSTHPMCCGGAFRRESFTFVGPHAENFFKNIRSHKAFIGGCGLTPENGLMDRDALEIQVKKAMMACSEQSILLLDGSKFGKFSALPAIPLAEVDILITDSSAPENIIQSLHNTEIDVHVINVA